MINPRLKAALQYASQGLYVFPVPPGEKKSYKSARYSNGQPWGRSRDEVEIKRDFMRWPNANVGLVTGADSGFWVLELDTPKGHAVDGIASFKKLLKKHREAALPETRQAISPTGSVHYYWQWPAEGIIKNSAGAVGAGIDVRGDGGMVVAPPSVRPGKGEYKWANKLAILKAPAWLLKLVAEKEESYISSNNGSLRANIGLVAAAVACLPNKAATTWDQWNCVGMAIWAACSGHESGFKIFDEWSQKWPLGYNGPDTADRWAAYSASPPVSIGAGSLFYMANAAQPGWRADYEASLPNALPQIRIEAGKLSEIANAAEKVLLDSGVAIFQRGWRMVRPVIETADASRGRLTSVAQFAQIDQVYLRDLLNRCADFRKYVAKNRSWAQCDPPMDTAATILARAGEWKYPIVSGVISTPTLRYDGSVLDVPGYDPETRLVLVEPPPTPDIKAAPTREEALRELKRLKGLLSEFVFADDDGTALSVALSAIISPVVRGAFSTVPMHVARAPVMASGKSYLFDIVASVAIGQPMPVMAAGRNEEETEKRLGAALLSGQPLISIDNVSGEIYGDALCQIIERPIVEIRILGRSERVRIEARATSTFCTGNNVVLVGDLVRRAITCTLDPGVEQPELRVFKNDPVAEVLDNRGVYIAACLTICRAYIVAGRPGKARRLASFEGWSDTVRSALIWLGETDPCASMEIARGEDPEINSLNAVLRSWGKTIGVGWAYRCSLGEVIELAEQRGEGGKHKWQELHDAVQTVAGRRGPPNATALARWARYRKNRIIGGLRLAAALDAHTKICFWWVQGAEGAEAAGAAKANCGEGGMKAPGDGEDVPF